MSQRFVRCFREGRLPEREAEWRRVCLLASRTARGTWGSMARRQGREFPAARWTGYVPVASGVRTLILERLAGLVGVRTNVQ